MYLDWARPRLVRGAAKPMEHSMSPKEARRPAKATVVGLALALPLLAGCAYDDGYYGPPAHYGYGYGYYGYSYGHPCSWRYDCDGWGHRRHHHRHHADDDDGNHHGGDDGAGNPPPTNPGGHASNTPRRPIFVNPPDAAERGSPRMGHRSPPPSQILIPKPRDSRR
jgi:hypothetical protein